MEDDFRPLLSSENHEENYSHRGSTESLDVKAKRQSSLKHYTNTLTYTVSTRTVLAYCLIDNMGDFYLFTCTLRTLVNKYQTTECNMVELYSTTFIMSRNFIPLRGTLDNSYSISDKSSLYRSKLLRNSQCSLPCLNCGFCSLMVPGNDVSLLKKLSNLKV